MLWLGEQGAASNRAAVFECNQNLFDSLRTVRGLCPIKRGFAFQHWVQIYHKDVYKKALAYARVMGWV